MHFALMVLYFNTTNSAKSQKFLLVPFHAKSTNLKRKVEPILVTNEVKTGLQIAQVDRVTLQ